MKKIIFNGKAILSVLMALVLFASTFVMSYAAGTGNTVQISLTGTFDYAKANEVLKLVNKERKADGKGNLKMSAELTKAAMKRAVEIAVYYSHTRPNGEDCFTVLDFHGYLGENIAAGDVAFTTEDIMQGWMDSQGHRENILRESFDSIGVGVFYQDGAIYWVQMFSGGAQTTKLTKTKAEKGTVKIDVLESNLDLQCQVKSDVYIGEKSQIDVCTVNPGFPYYDTKIDSTCFNFKSKSTSVAKVDSKGNITPVSVGKTTITATLKGSTLNAKTTVTVSSGSYELKNENGTWYCYKRGEWQYDHCGLVKHTNGVWYYVENGRIDWSKTGLVEHTNGMWYYVKKGRLDWSKTGLVKHTNGSWYYVKDGRVNKSKTGLVKHTDGKWYYVENGIIDFSKTGFVEHTNGKWYYVEKGKVASTKTGLFKRSHGKWYYIKNGCVDSSKTGLVKHTNGDWYYVENGKINFSKTGYVKHTNGKRYYVKNGVYSAA